MREEYRGGRPKNLCRLQKLKFTIPKPFGVQCWAPPRSPSSGSYHPTVYISGPVFFREWTCPPVVSVALYPHWTHPRSTSKLKNCCLKQKQVSKKDCPHVASPVRQALPSRTKRDRNRHTQICRCGDPMAQQGARSTPSLLYRGEVPH